MPALLGRRGNRDYRSGSGLQVPTRPAQAHGHNPEPAREPIPDWAKLSREDDVTLYFDGQELASGRVDMRALDGSVLWIIHHDGRGRAMFLHSDGLMVFRHRTKNKPIDRVFYKA